MKLKEVIWTIGMMVCFISGGTAQVEPPRTLIVIFDGLREDYINEKQMPNLYRFTQQATYGANNHSVFPTYTRVNSASFGTGAYPHKHGILGNALHVPGVAGDRVFQTGDANELIALDSLTQGNLVTVGTFGEAMKAAGKEFMVFSSGSTGQALLQNPKGAGRIVNPTLILPRAFQQEVYSKVGDPKHVLSPVYTGHHWVTDAFLAYGLASDAPLVSSIWYSEPDGAQHRSGIGSDDALSALTIVDGLFGRLLDTLWSPTLKSRFNIVVTADHGFVAYQGQQKLEAFVAADDVVSAEGAIFVRGHDQVRIRQIVEKLRRESWVGPIFTQAVHKGSKKGWVPGTLSFDAIHWNHPTRAADILVTYKWHDQPGPRGYRGTAENPGVAGHGGISPFEIKTPLFFSGPLYQSNSESELPSSFVDLAPTILASYGIPVPETMDGRILSEFFVNDQGGNPSVTQEVIENAPSAVHRSSVYGKWYVDYGQTH